MGIIIRVLLIAYGVWVGYQLRGDVDQMKKDKKEFKIKHPTDAKVLDLKKHL